MFEPLCLSATTPMSTHRKVPATEVREAFGNVGHAEFGAGVSVFRSIDRAEVRIGTDNRSRS